MTSHRFTHSGHLRRTLLALAAVVAGTALMAAAHAQQPAWPTKPVRIIVPAPAGSSLDIVARLLSDKLKDTWAQPVLVENRPGAGGMIGVDIAAKAAPDGHTLALGFNGPLAFAPALYKKVPYDAFKDIVPVAMTTVQPNVLAVNAAVPANSIKDLVAYAKANPGKLNYGSIGAGSSSHLSMEFFKRSAGIDAVHVPYNGSPPAALSLANGDTQMLFAVASGIMPQVKAGKIRLLAVTSAKRFDSLADLPTIAESGLPALRNFEALAWNGLVAAAATPADVVKKINADVNAVLNQTEIKARLFAQGMQVAPTTPAGFKAVIDGDSKKWGSLIVLLGIRLD